MKTGYFRILRFEPDKGLLELSQHELDDPEARIAYCEWNELHEDPYVPYGKIHLDSGEIYYSEELVHLIMSNCSLDNRRRAWQTVIVI